MLSNTKIKPIITLSCILLTLLALFCIGNAEASAETYSGDCGADGDNVKWSYNQETGVLDITGTGAMIHYDARKYQTMPWGHYTISIKTVNIGEGITAISAGAFRFCLNLTSVTIPSTVTSIGIDAFSLCNKLTDVHVADIEGWCGLTFSNAGTNPLSIAKNLYVNGELVTDLVITEGTTKISNMAFYRCQALKSVTIGGTVNDVRADAFYSCPNLTTVTVGESVRSIGAEAFKDCTALTELTLGSKVKTIGTNAFENCTSLTGIYLGDGITQIGSGAFLNTAYYNGKNWRDGVLYIGSYLISASANKIGSYTVKDGTRVIANNAFEYCKLTEINLPNSLTHICSDAFYYCAELTTVTMGEGIEYIGSNAFYYCRKLSSVTFPKTDSWHLDDKGAPQNGTELSAETVSDPATVARKLINSFFDWNRVTHIHEYVAAVTLPTCNSIGYTTYTCRCEDSYIANQTAKTDHVAGDWIIDTEAKSGTEGSKHRQCTVCSAVLETEIIPAITEFGCFGDSGMYLSYLMTVLIPAAFVFLGKSLFM